MRLLNIYSKTKEKQKFICIGKDSKIPTNHCATFEINDKEEDFILKNSDKDFDVQFVHEEIRKNDNLTLVLPKGFELAKVGEQMVITSNSNSNTDTIKVLLVIINILLFVNLILSFIMR